VVGIVIYVVTAIHQLDQFERLEIVVDSCVDKMIYYSSCLIETAVSGKRC